MSPLARHKGHAGLPLPSCHCRDRQIELDAREEVARSRTPPSPARRIRASRCARSTARTPCAACRRRPSPGSVAPISVRHFLIASGASRTSTIAGPDDMNAVRLREERALAVHRVEAFGLLLRQMHAPHGTNLESLVLDALNDPAGEMPFHGVRLDDRQRPLGHPPIIAGATSAIWRRMRGGTHDTEAPPTHTTIRTATRARSKAIRPDATNRSGNPHGRRRRQADGLPERLRSRPRRTRIGANVDEIAGVKNLQLVNRRLGELVRFIGNCSRRQLGRGIVPADAAA